MKTILLVSKDRIFTDYFEKRMEQNQYELIATEEENSALEHLEGETTDLVVVDVSIGNFNESLIERIQSEFPGVIRMSVTDLRTTSENHMPAFEGISQLNCNKTHSSGEIWQLISKIFEIEKKVKNKELLSLMSTMKNVPTLPEIYFSLNHMIRNNASVEDIAEKLESDPAITSSILKLANTAFYNAKTGSIRQAIMYIGLINVKHIILSNAVFGNDGLDPKIRDIHWQHVGLTNKILGAMYVELLGKKLNTNIASIGLLHDIGSVVLMSNFPKEFDEVVKLVSSDKKLGFEETEKKIIGFSHEELGGYLLDLWGLPYPMIEAALMHHNPLSPDIINKELVMAVHVANYYAWKAMNYTKYDNFINKEVLHKLEITQKAFDEFYVNLMTKL
ncbi:MAG: HDOD domain-containing protein [Clostridia bacterium]|nr:HDOD domain-containing protein [Clostridia bacterium]